MKLNFEFTYKNQKEYRMIFETVECLVAALEQSDSESVQAERSNGITESPPDMDVMEKDTVYSVEDVRKALTSLARSRGKAAAKSILKELGAESVTGVSAADYPRAMSLIEKAAV